VNRATKLPGWMATDPASNFTFRPALTFDVTRTTRYSAAVLRSFAGKKTEALWNGQRVPAFDAFRERAERKLVILDSATTLETLGALPGNRLEALKGDRKGQHSIRINDQWRLCFRWHQGDAYDVEIVDYH
jgi:toxin HigB-1